MLAQAFIRRVEGLTDPERQAWLDEGHGWRVAEQAKRDLGEQDLAQLTHTWRGQELAASISRAEFEEASKELLQRLRRPIERALADAQLDVSGLSEVVLVGGATRMPMIRQLVTRLFQRLPLRHLDPDLAVAPRACRPGSRPAMPRWTTWC